MNRKKKDRMNLLFSAFLVTAFMVCASFFTGMIHDSFAQNFTAHTLLLSLIFLLFGLLLFYATRVGDGRQMVRFSPATLIVMVLPSLYIVIASVAKFMPLSDIFASQNPGTVSVITALAAVALGYGLPYTFLSGFEMEPETVTKTEETTVLEGGVEADVIGAAEETAEKAEEAVEETTTEE